MKKGDAARELVEHTIISAFDAKKAFVAYEGKKIYVQVPDGPNGTPVQFAISITMPKNPIASTSQPSESSSMTELSPEDNAKVKELMRKLNI